MIVHLNFPDTLKRPPVEMKRSVMLVGRHPECDIRLKVPSISRRHCCLAQVNDDVFVRDLGSRHGVWVNGRRVDQSILNAGDELAIGPLIFTITTTEPADSGPIEPPVANEELSALSQPSPSNLVPPRRVAEPADDELMDLDVPLSGVQDDPPDEPGLESLDDSGVGPGLGLRL